MRRFVLLVVVSLGAVLLPATVVNAADFTVNNSGDATDSVPGNGVCATAGGVCTLRAAIAEAEALPGPDKITLPAMTITLGSQLTITKTTTVQGAGARSTIITGTPGHILVKISGGDVELRDLALQGQVANGGGGLAIQQTGNAATKLLKVRVVGNKVTGSAAPAFGAVYVNAGEMLIQDSEISGNSVSTTNTSYGAGIYVAGGTTRVDVQNSTIHGNTATAGGVGGSAFGGGVTVLGGSTVTFRSSTITGNAAANTTSASAAGGNVYQSVSNVTFTDSIVAGGSAILAGTGNCFGAATFTGTNVVSDTSCGAGNASRIIADPQLGPQQNNGGSTNTRSPAVTSPAVDALPSCAFPADQRGQQRPIGPGCDIGSVELGADLSVTQSVSNSNPGPGSDVVFTVMVVNAGMDNAPAAQMTAAIDGGQAITSASATQGNCTVSGTSVTCGLGIVVRDQPTTIVIVARAPGSGSMTSTASVSSGLPDPNAGNNTAQSSLSVIGSSPTVVPGRCANVVNGNNKPNRLRGTADGDRIRGFGKRDVLRGLAGDDCLSGDAGNDRLIAGPGNDQVVGGKGRDKVSAGAGDDLIKVRDRRRDIVKCGSGTDRVIADRVDRIRKDCEKVKVK